MKNYHLSDKRTISARKAMETLRKHGTVVSINEAELILDFMYKFAKLSLKQVLERDSGNISPKVKTPRRLFK